VTPETFRSALARVPPAERDAWVDRFLGIEGVPDDGPELPRGCVPYWPCPVDTVLRAIEQADVRDGDVFVDVGSGLGRAAALACLITGATAIGVEVQPHLARAARALAARASLPRLSVIEGDAVRLAGTLASATVFFLYCPFSGERLATLLDGLEPLARTRSIRVCAVDVPLPARPWLTPLGEPDRDLEIYRSTGP
jgi:hypothetical protein